MDGNGAAPGSAPLRSSDRGRGTGQGGVRPYNERLVLSLIRRHGSLPKAEIARLTGLSAQTSSVIAKRLEVDGLLRREEPRRGKVGQPLVPFSLNPDGAYSLGLKIGRRSGELILMDLVGGVRETRRRSYAYLTPSDLLEFTREGLRSITAGLSSRELGRISGLGIAAPYEMWNWEEEVGAPRAVLDDWRAFDVQKETAALCDWPVLLCNDGTAACAAELVFGNSGRHTDFLYFFIGSFVGGGVVINGSLYPGRRGNAGAVGSMPITLVDRNGGHSSRQLIRSASKYVLERKLIAAGRDAAVIWRSPEDWGDVGALLDEWIEDVSESLAFAVVSAISVIDFEAVIIDGAVPPAVRRAVVDRTAEKVRGLDLQGLSPVTLHQGTVGSGARAIGGASLPLLANFALYSDVPFRGCAAE